MTNVEILVELKEVDNDITVYKPTGEKPYIVKRQIDFFPEKNLPKIEPIRAETGVAFLVADNGSISVVSEFSKVKLILPVEEAVDFLSMKIEKED